MSSMQFEVVITAEAEVTKATPEQAELSANEKE